MFYTYVIRSKKDKKCYTGATADLRKRFEKNRLKRFLSLTGFTLIEILFVVIILSILIGFSIPQLKNTYDNLQLNNFSKDLQSYMNYLCGQATVTGETIYLTIDNDNKKYWATVAGDKSRLKTVTIPDGIELVADEKQIAFYPDGSIDKVAIKLSNGDKGYVSLTTKGVFGSVKMQTKE